MAAPNVHPGSTGIDLRGVPDGTYPLSLQGETLEVDAELRQLLVDFRFEGTLDWTQGARRVRGALGGRFRSMCDRCLVAFDREVRLDVDVTLAVGQEARPTDPEQSPDVVLRVTPEELSFDLAGPFRAAVLLEVPIKNLCRSDCRGLCPVCGADRNAATCACEPPRGDPRWEALGGLSFPRNEE